MSILRENAKMKLDQLIVTANAINADNYYAYIINQIYVFGSYVNSDKVKLGDLDIAMSMSIRDKYKGRDIAELGIQRSEKQANNRSILSQMFFAQEETIIKLKGKQKSIHIGGIYDPDSNVDITKWLMLLCNGEYQTLL